MRADPSHWLLASILLLAGAHMVMNPDSFTTLAQNLTDGIRNFERTLHAPLWRDPWRRQWRGRRPINISPSRSGIRAMGLLVIAVGLLAAAIS